MNRNAVEFCDGEPHEDSACAHQTLILTALPKKVKGGQSGEIRRNQKDGQAVTTAHLSEGPAVEAWNEGFGKRGGFPFLR